MNQRSSSGHAHIKSGRALAGIAILLTVLICPTLYASGHNQMSNQSEIALQIGEKGEDFARRIHQAKVDQQPAGLNFYELRWQTANKGNVVIRNGSMAIPIENVLSVTGVEDTDSKDEGIFQIRINSTLSNAETIGHDEARLKVFVLLDKIRRTGAQTLIPSSMARIRGRDMTKYLLRTKKQTTLDPADVPSLSEWMAFESLTSWQFYADRLFIKIQFTREQSLLDPAKPGAYLMSITLKSEREHFRGYVKPSDRPRWKELLPAAIAETSKRRAAMEAEFRLLGIAIDDSYDDPPLPRFPHE